MSLGLRERNRVAAKDSARRAAFDLMTQRGFDAVTVEEIAATTGVSPSTLYRYFGTKEALVLSSSRTEQLIERLGSDTSRRGWAEAVQRAAAKVWGTDDTARQELGLIVANESLLHAWERQLLDQRTPLAELFAQRRDKSRGAKDDVRAAVAIAVLTATLLRWHRDDGDRKDLARLLKKAFQSAQTE